MYLPLPNYNSGNNNNNSNNSNNISSSNSSGSDIAKTPPLFSSRAQLTMHPQHHPQVAGTLQTSPVSSVPLTANPNHHHGQMAYSMASVPPPLPIGAAPSSSGAYQQPPIQYRTTNSQATSANGTPAAAHIGVHHGSTTRGGTSGDVGNSSFDINNGYGQSLHAHQQAQQQRIPQNQFQYPPVSFHQLAGMPQQFNGSMNSLPGRSQQLNHHQQQLQRIHQQFQNQQQSLQQDLAQQQQQNQYHQFQDQNHQQQHQQQFEQHHHQQHDQHLHQHRHQLHQLPQQYLQPQKHDHQHLLHQLLQKQALHSLNPRHITQINPQELSQRQINPLQINQMSPQQINPLQINPLQISPQQISPQQINPLQINPLQVNPQQVSLQQVKPPQMNPQQVYTPLLVVSSPSLDILHVQQLQQFQNGHQHQPHNLPLQQLQVVKKSSSLKSLALSKRTAKSLLKKAQVVKTPALENQASKSVQLTPNIQQPPRPSPPMPEGTKKRGRPKKYLFDATLNIYIDSLHPNFRELNKIAKSEAAAAASAKGEDGYDELTGAKYKKSKRDDGSPGMGAIIADAAPQLRAGLARLCDQPPYLRSLEDDAVKQLIQKKDRRGRPRKFPIEETGITIKGIRVNGRGKLTKLLAETTKIVKQREMDHVGMSYN